MKKILEKYKLQFKLLSVLSIGLVALTVIYYFLIPMILNYPDGTYGTNFQIEVENTFYLTQVLLIASAIFSIFVTVTFLETRFLTKYSDLINIV